MTASTTSNTRTRIKICGITCREDAQACVAAGVDALGFVFYAPSPRAVDIAQAAAIVNSLPAFITSVGLFLDPEPALVESVLEQLPLDMLQFHGREEAAFCRQFSRPYIKTLGMHGNTNVVAQVQAYPDARSILLDSHATGQAGGTGQPFDWQQIPAIPGMPVILAGGLNATNIAQAVSAVRPFAVDVSSGVEAAPGQKDPRKITEFVAQVRRADSENYVN